MCSGSFDVVEFASTVRGVVVLASTVRVGVLHDTLAALMGMSTIWGGE